MPEIENLEFLDHWLTDFGKTLQELRAGIQRLGDRLNRETDRNNDWPGAASENIDFDALSGW
jgi:hypothetical protein